MLPQKLFSKKVFPHQTKYVLPIFAGLPTVPTAS